MANAALDALVAATDTYVSVQTQLDKALSDQAVTAQKAIDLATLIAELQGQLAAAQQAAKTAADNAAP